MKKKWLPLCALVILSASVASGATAYWMGKQQKVREAALLADARQAAQQAAQPVLLPIWFLNKVKSAFGGAGGCALTGGTSTEVASADGRDGQCPIRTQ